jgi:hypothetical protein
MNTLSIFLGTLIALAIGSFFHFLRGGGLNRLLLYLATAWIAFFTGHLVGSWLNMDFLIVGSLYLFPAVLASLLGLVISSLLARPEKKEPQRRKRR